LHLGVEPEIARDWLVLLALLVGGLGCALYAERQGRSPQTALALAAAFQVLCAWLTALGRALPEGAAWLPWCLWALSGISRREPLRGAGPLLALAVGLAWNAGAVELGLLATLVTLAATLVRRVPFPRKAVLAWVVLGTLLGAVRWVPWIDVSRHGLRAPVTQGFDELSWRLLVPGRLVEAEDAAPAPARAALETLADIDGRVLRFRREAAHTPCPPNRVALAGHGALGVGRRTGPRTAVELLGTLDELLADGHAVGHLSDAALLRHPLLDLAEVRAVLSTERLGHRVLAPLFEREGTLVYAREESYGPARIVPTLLALDDDASVLAALRSATIDPSDAALIASDKGPLPPAMGAAEAFSPGTWTLHRLAPHRADVVVEGSSGGWLVFHEAWYPGWKATVNGTDADVWRVDHAFRAVKIPAGDSIVRTKYEPWSLRIGASLSVLALFAIGGAVRFLARRTLLPRGT
jgi:hypothetical protein